MDVGHHAWCDGCSSKIISVRYKCKQCREFNLCFECKDDGIHRESGHLYFEIGRIGVGHRCGECNKHIYVWYQKTRHYKCYTCANYDVCETCKTSGRHAYHSLLCVEWISKELHATRATGEMLQAPTSGYLEMRAEIKPKVVKENQPTSMIKTSDVEIHFGVACDGCKITPIRGIRFKCAQCQDFDLCENCKGKVPHAVHTFLRVKSEQGRINQTSSLYNTWETERDLVQFGVSLGKGGCGQVYRGSWKNIPVAIKMLHGDAMDKKAFIQEAEIMSMLKHNNVMSLLAVVSRNDPILIITEYMNQGSLTTYLRLNKNALPMRTLIWIAMEVADGMRYLERKTYVHRDLAARNVLVATGADATLAIKISDFGLTRLLHSKQESDTLVYNSTSDVFSLRWTAPEAMPPTSKFTIKSDVWSFGVLLTEIVTFGQFPYPGLRNTKIESHVKSGQVMRCPVGCPAYLYSIMKRTWAMKPCDRPTFQDIMTSLQFSFTE